MTQPTLEHHETRIVALEKSDEQTQRRLDVLERNHSDLKITIMDESRDTRRDFRTIIERLINSGEADKTRDDEIRRERNNNVKDIMLAIFGAGGLIAFAIEFIFK